MSKCRIRWCSWLIPLIGAVVGDEPMIDRLAAAEYSKAGFYEVEDSGREVFSFNLGWRLYQGDQPGAEQVDFDDSKWKVVNCPNGIEYTPSEASGSCNYQGPAWYRKHFHLTEKLSEKVLKLHFEAVMGKCKVWLNGHLIGEHYGGYLPFSVTLNKYLIPNGKNVVAVWADNRDDPTYPPGKPQTGLDFTYFGGIYRDVWLVATNSVYVTNPNDVDKVAGGGILVALQELSDDQVTLSASVDLQNDLASNANLRAQFSLVDPAGKIVTQSSKSLQLGAGRSTQVEATLQVARPQLWTPWSPWLYRLEIRLTDSAGDSLDGVATRVGLRKIEFRGREGLYLNNRPYPGKLMGANRHQDHGYVGYAIPNNGQWRDAKILKQASCDIVRAGHYPADPAFMDACDELGIFFIVATPGWQFWNEDDPQFEDRVYADIRQMVRRDRNHPCVLLWEPVLNETFNPDRVTIKGHEIVHEEHPDAFTACDRLAGGNEVYDVVYSHAELDYSTENRSIFQREFGSVGSTNTPNRIHRDWGEHAQLFQARQYAESSLGKASWELICRSPRQFVGGALWHSFDHFAGKHPRPFYGGIADVFRQAKYSYQLFVSQRDPSETVEPMVYLAHELTPFSAKDVTVYTNCEEVRLTVNEGQKVFQQKARLSYKKKLPVRRTWANRGKKREFVTDHLQSMPHPIVTFENAFRYEETFNRPLLKTGKSSQPGMLVEGLIDGQVVASMEKRVPLNGRKIVLRLEDRGLPLTADGSDFVVVVASVVDRNGTIVRLHENTIEFHVSGEGQIIGDASIAANPRRMEWGTAPLLVRSTTKPDKIKIRANLLHAGPRTIQGGELEFSSVPASDGFVFNEIGAEVTGENGHN